MIGFPSPPPLGLLSEPERGTSEGESKDPNTASPAMLMRGVLWMLLAENALTLHFARNILAMLRLALGRLTTTARTRLRSIVLAQEPRRERTVACQILHAVQQL